MRYRRPVRGSALCCCAALLSCNRAETPAHASEKGVEGPRGQGVEGSRGQGVEGSRGRGVEGALPITSALPPSASPSRSPDYAPEVPRVYSKTRFVWIRQAPDSSTQWIGYLWTGESAELFTGRPVYGPGCMYWYAVKPVGYVCVDGLRATLDPNDPGYLAAKKYAADLSSPWPH